MSPRSSFIWAISTPTAPGNLKKKGQRILAIVFREVRLGELKVVQELCNVVYKKILPFPFQLLLLPWQLLQQESTARCGAALMH